jgi:phage tail-like protein
MQFLPAIMREGERDGKANLLGRFLKIFEKILTGIHDDARLLVTTPDGTLQEHEVIGIEQILDRLHNYFDPLFTPPIAADQQTSADFIAYLSQWVALMQNQTWDIKSQRRLLNRIVPLYKKRGTELGLSEYLKIYLQEFIGSEVTIKEFLEGIQVGASATVGQDTVVGGAPPYFFFVQIHVSKLQGFYPVSNLVANTRAIVDLEKPAHTYYAVLYDIPGMIVGERSSVAEDTFIGSRFGIFA